MIEVISCGPLVTVQDGGRPGHLSQGLARGGAADRLALREARALLGSAGAGLEIPRVPLCLRFHASAQIALTGAPMRTRFGERPLEWHASHQASDGDVLTLIPGTEGVYSYVHVAGGLLTPEILGGRAAHLVAKIGQALRPGDRLPFAASTGPGARVVPGDRFRGGLLRVLPTPQTRLFSKAERDRFAATDFRRDPRGNRQGVRLAFEGAGFAVEEQLNLLSDFILPGDVQMTGDGVPYILGPECQTTGGYPRIGTVIGADLPRAFQAPPDAPLRFRFVGLEEVRALRPATLQVTPLVRAPSEVPDLLAKQLIGGVVSAKEDE